MSGANNVYIFVGSIAQPLMWRVMPSCSLTWPHTQPIHLPHILRKPSHDHFTPLPALVLSLTLPTVPLPTLPNIEQLSRERKPLAKGDSRPIPALGVVGFLVVFCP